MEIGRTIQFIRKRSGVSQETLSQKTGISQTSISQIEGGHKQPSKPSIKKICAALKVPEAVVFILSVEDSDVPKERKKMFDKLYPEIKELAMQILGDQ